MDFKEKYQRKVVSVEEALQRVKSHDMIVCGMAACEPATFLSQLHTIKDRVKDVTVVTGIMGGSYDFFMNPSMHGHFRNITWMYERGSRLAHFSGTVSYLPVQMHQLGYFLTTEHHINIFVGCASSMDKHGYFSLSLSTILEKDCLERADLVILEVVPNLPRTYGDTQVHISEVDLVIETDREVPLFNPSPVDEKDRIIGQYVADLIEDGSTIQLGIGNIPSAVAQSLKDKHDLGVHSGLISDSILDLYEAGAITNRCKTLWKNKFITCLAVGTKRLYDFLDNNMAIEFHRGSIVNNPTVIAKNNKMVSINTAIQLDLTGQCCAESIGPHQFSGAGGLKAWLAGSAESQGGKSILAFHSTLKDDTVSRIVPWLDVGSIVTSSRVDIHYVVTEYGVANLRGRSIRERVQQLINIAHPIWRDFLRFEAEKKQIW